MIHDEHMRLVHRIAVLAQAVSDYVSHDLYGEALSCEMIELAVDARRILTPEADHVAEEGAA